MCIRDIKGPGALFLHCTFLFGGWSKQQLPDSITFDHHNLQLLLHTCSSWWSPNLWWRYLYFIHLAASSLSHWGPDQSASYCSLNCHFLCSGTNRKCCSLDRSGVMSSNCINKLINKSNTPIPSELWHTPIMHCNISWVNMCIDEPITDRSANLWLLRLIKDILDILIQTRAERVCGQWLQLDFGQNEIVCVFQWAGSDWWIAVLIAVLPHLP